MCGSIYPIMILQSKIDRQQQAGNISVSSAVSATYMQPAAEVQLLLAALTPTDAQAAAKVSEIRLCLCLCLWEVPMRYRGCSWWQDNTVATVQSVTSQVVDPPL